MSNIFTILQQNKKELAATIFVFVFFVAITLLLGWIFYNPKGFLNLIIEWNHSFKWSNYWIGLYFIYLSEIFLIFLIFDLVMHQVLFVVRFFYSELTHLLVNKRWILVKLVRLKYGFDKFHYYVKPNILKYAGFEDKGLIKEITAARVIDILLSLFFSFLSFYSILAVVLTCLTYDISLIDGAINGISEKWILVSQFLWENFTKLSAIIVFILIIFLWYFVSGFGVRQRAIAQANKKNLEEVIQLFRKLDEPIIEIILSGSKNIEYAIKCYGFNFNFRMLDTE
ncbi:hypothetical protein ACE3MZ_23590 [Paenibacillus sp. WLX1005]|uniref:hypothetical protein n=1 Tax=Paenibacillus sp. WLX1005 TaxID=3243766 RepID=UPI0039844C5C